MAPALTRVNSRSCDVKSFTFPQHIRVRWRVFGILFAFALIAYVQQKSITIAAARMMPELGLSQLQIGWLEQAFILGYTIFQLPSGLIGQRLGARVAYTLSGLTAFVAAIATPLLPMFVAGAHVFLALAVAQFVLGIGQGGRFPVASGVYATWFPFRQWSLVQGLATVAISLGAALTPPLIATLTIEVGWQRAVAWASCPALLILGVWFWYARNTPQEHWAVSSAELAELNDGRHVPVDSAIGGRRLLRILASRNTILLTGSYIIMNYCFYLLSNWCFLYLIQERHLSIAESGWLATGPPLAAALGAAIGGALAGKLCARFGVAWGFRIVPLVALPIAAALLVVAMQAEGPYAAVAALTMCFGCLELTEGSFWGASMAVGQGDTMAISGIVNTGGCLGGIIGIPIIAYLSGHHSWKAAFVIGSLTAVVSALLWLGINASQAANNDTIAAS